MAGARQPGPLCQVSRPMRVEDGTLCRMPSPVPGVLGSGYDPVANWSVRTKLLEAARRATRKLPPESRDQFAALFSPDNIGIIAGVFAAWGASHLFGVGEAADVILVGVGAFTIGWQSVGIARDLAHFAAISARADTGNQLDSAATHLARAVVTIGVTAFIALVFKAGKRFLGRGALTAREATVGGEAIVPGAGEGGPWWKAYDFGDNWPGTAVPKGFVMETGGQTFRVTINATEHMAEKVGKVPARADEQAGKLLTGGQLNNPGVWSTSPGARMAQVEYPLSSLAGSLEQAAQKYGRLSPQRFPLEIFGNWELGIDTRVKPWVVEHALPGSK